MFSFDTNVLWFRNQLNIHSHICPKAPEVLFDNRSTYFNGVDDDQYQQPVSARVSSASLSRQLSSTSLNQSMNRMSSSENGPLRIRFRPLDLSVIAPMKENRARSYNSITNMKHKG